MGLIYKLIVVLILLNKLIFDTLVIKYNQVIIFLSEILKYEKI